MRLDGSAPAVHRVDVKGRFVYIFEDFNNDETDFGVYDGFGRVLKIDGRPIKS